jgi:hypothetical protein
MIFVCVSICVCGCFDLRVCVDVVVGVSAIATHTDPCPSSPARHHPCAGAGCWWPCRVYNNTSFGIMIQNTNKQRTDSGNATDPCPSNRARSSPCRTTPCAGAGWWWPCRRAPAPDHAHAHTQCLHELVLCVCMYVCMYVCVCMYVDVYMYVFEITVYRDVLEVDNMAKHHF